jgi:hypothetical protein
MTLYICWRSLDRTADVVKALSDAYMALPMRGALASPADNQTPILKVTERVAASTAFVWVLGPYTLDLVNEEGKRLLALRDDMQHIELEAALRYEVPIIVLRYHAPPLTEEDLPRDLKTLAAAPQLEWETAEATIPDVIALVEKLRRPPRTEPLPPMRAARRARRPLERLRRIWHRWVKGMRACAALLGVLFALLVFTATVAQMLFNLR